MVRVATPTRARAQQLANSGLDVTEHGGAGFLDVVLHGAADARKLRDAGFQYVDAGRRTSRSRAARDRARRRGASPPPTSRPRCRAASDTLPAAVRLLART